jgi:hypothetical protein
VPSTNPYARVTDIDAGVGTDTQEGGASAIAELKSGLCHHLGHGVALLGLGRGQ